MIVNRDPGDETGFVDPYESRQSSIFADVNEAIKDIDYYKATAEAEHNAFVAASEYSVVWKNNWVQAKCNSEVYRRRAFRAYVALGVNALAVVVLLIDVLAR